jgi:hypothetical protein
MVGRKMDELTEESNEDDENTTFIRFNMTGDTRDMFLEIKEYLNLRYNMEVFRYLVKRTHDDLIKKK